MTRITSTDQKYQKKFSLVASFWGSACFINMPCGKCRL